MSAYLDISGIGKSFGQTQALKTVDLQVEQGEFLALLGPSGCGKTTLLRILAGLESASKGKILLGGQEITARPAWERDIGLVFQSYALFPHMTVRENIAFGLSMRGIKGREAEARIDEALDIVSMRDFGKRRPAQMSGGQQQRIAIARAIAIKPRLLLLDEPLSNLDAVLRQSVRVELRELHDRTGLTTLMVTHDQAEALTIADRVALMAGGKVEQFGTPQEIYERPASGFVAGFIGAPPANLIKAEITAEGLRLGGQIWRPSFETLPQIAPLLRPENHRRQILLALRPEALTLSHKPQANTLKAEIRRAEYMGAEHLVHIDLAGQPLLLRQAEPPPPSGEALSLAIRKIAGIYDIASGARLGPQGE